MADHATEELLRTIVQQISDGRIISPSDDNAMQTWQRVLQRDIATQGSPEVLKALEDFDTYARVRAANEKTAGRVLVAAELTVFADQASRMTGRTLPLDTPGRADTAGNDTPRGQSGDRSAAPAAATDSGIPPAQSTAAAIGATSPNLPAATTGSGTTSIALPSASAGTAIAAQDVTNGAVPDAQRAGVAASATKAATDTVTATRATGGIASVTQAVMHMAPQTFGTTPISVDTTGSDGSSPRSAGNVTDGAGSAAPHAVDTAAAAATSATGSAPNAAAERAAAAQIAATVERPQVPATGTSSGGRAQSADASAPPRAVATGEAPQAPTAGVTARTSTAETGNAVPAPSAGTTAVVTGVPFEQLAGQLRAEAQDSAESGSHGTMIAETQSTALPVAGGAATTVAQAAPGTGNALSSANTSAAPQPAAPESAMAAFYAGRGDAMLAHRDISAARKFYEYAANEGSARAAAALARTYDPAFAVQLGEVGLRPDPGLAAVWYRKAAELGGNPAQLSQSGDTGK